MNPAVRKEYNTAFTEKKYQQMIADICEGIPGGIDFRLAETPVFIDIALRDQLLVAGKEIGNYITGPTFKESTQHALKQVATPPNETELPDCIVMDFAICSNEQGQLFPQLIELQGFPSLFGFETRHDQAFQNNFNLPKGYSPYLNDYDEKTYLAFLSTIIKGKENKHTVLLELFPHEQKTKIDFYITQQILNIPIVCVSELIVVENKLFYERAGIQYPIERIYNRVVWDEINKQSAAIQAKVNLLLADLDIEWVTHPNHFYRISKYLLPLLRSKYVPSAYFLSELTELPRQLENYVLKPLFSFAGQGVIIDVQASDLLDIQDPENWILQEKVSYAPTLDTPTGPAKTEIRLFYFLDKKRNKYIATLNLARISKGKMIGVAYNANATWVGGSIAYFEQD
jgi:hypothetical protein